MPYRRSSVFLHEFVPYRRSSAVLTCVCALQTIVGRCDMHLCLTDDLRLFLHAFVPQRRFSAVFTSVCASQTIAGRFTCVCALQTIVGRFYMRLCLSTRDSALQTIVGRFYTSLCLTDDGRLILPEFVPCRRSSAVSTRVCVARVVLFVV